MATLRFGACELDLDARQLLRDGQGVRLPPKAFELLRILVTQRPKAVSKAELLERIWPGTFVTEDSLAKTVTQARAAIGDTAETPSFIRTVHAFGYAFVGQEAVPQPAYASAWLMVDGRATVLMEGVNTLGRDPTGQIALDSVRVSRTHARITVTGETAVLEDLGSRNGTFVGGVRIERPWVLADGDEITVGGFRLRFRSAAASLPTEAD